MPIAQNSFILPIVAYLCALIFGFAVPWLFFRVSRKISTQPSESLSHLDRAFLLGGPRRTIEVTFFHLAIENWIRPIGNGSFASRLSTSGIEPTALLPLEREMLEALSPREEFSPVDALGLSYKTLPQIENNLVKKQLLISGNDASLSKIATLIPMAALTFWSLAHLVINARAHLHDSRWMILLIFCFIALVKFINSRERLTSLGKSQQNLIISESRIRIQQSQIPSLDGNPSTYDLLWRMSDQVLLRGLGALAGTSFMGTVSSNKTPP